MTTRSTSTLETIASSLFYEVCSYLSLDHKCRTFPLLSKRMKQLFVPSQCCRGFVSLDLTEDLAPLLQPREAGRLHYVQYATRLSMRLCFQFEMSVERDVVDNLVNYTCNALKSGTLKALYLREEFHMSLPFLTPLLLFELNGSAVKLRELWLHFEAFEPQQFDWKTLSSRLKQCKTLTLLHLTFTGFTPNLDTVLTSLPDRIEELIIDANACHDEYIVTSWRQALMKNDFLPHLKRFRMSTTNVDCDRITTDVLLSTIMQSTGKIRPIEFIQSISCQPNFIHFPLQELEIDRFDQKAASSLTVSKDGKRLLSINQSNNPSNNQSNNQSIKQLAIQDGAFHHLKRFKAAIYLDSVHCPPFLLLVSLPSLIEIHLEFRTHNRTMLADVLNALSRASSLEYLHLDFPGGGDNLISSLMADVPIACWSKLVLLHIHTSFMSETFLRALLRASPKCRQIELIDEAPLMHVVKTFLMVIHHCPLAVRIKVLEWIPAVHSIQHVDTFLPIFRQYPILADHVKHLKWIYLPFHNCCESALHLLCHHLMQAPQLQWIDLQLRNPSLLSIFLLHRLPHMITPRLPFDGPLDGVTIDKLMAHCAYKVNAETPTVYEPLERMRSSRHKLSQLLRAETFDEFVEDECNGSPGHCYLFKQHGHDIGRTGRHQLADSLYNMLNKQDKLYVDIWDSGSYSKCCANSMMDSCMPSCACS